VDLVGLQFLSRWIDARLGSNRHIALHLYKAIQSPIASLSPLSHLHWDL
jgi:hypothetical protein